MGSPRLPNQLMHWDFGEKDFVQLLEQLDKEYSDLVEITTSRRF